MQDQSQQSVPASGSGPRADSLLTEMLRAQVCSSSEVSFLIEAHDGLSAAIAKRVSSRVSGRRACQLPARWAAATPMKRPGANSPT